MWQFRIVYFDDKRDTLYCKEDSFDSFNEALEDILNCSSLGDGFYHSADDRLVNISDDKVRTIAYRGEKKDIDKQKAYSNGYVDGFCENDHKYLDDLIKE